MTSTYSPNLGIELIESGTGAGTWGDTTNNNIVQLDQAIGGSDSIQLTDPATSGAPNIVYITNEADRTALSEGRNALLEFTDDGTLATADAYVRFDQNTCERLIWITNNLTTVDNNLIIFQGTYDVSRAYILPYGNTALLKFDGGGIASAFVTNVFESGSLDSGGISLKDTTGTTTDRGDISLDASGTMILSTTSGGSLEIQADNDLRYMYSAGAGVSLFFDYTKANWNFTRSAVLGIGVAGSGYAQTVTDPFYVAAEWITGSALGTASYSGGQVVLHRDDDPTTPNKIVFKSNASVGAEWDNGAWDFQGNALLTTGVGLIGNGLSVGTTVLPTLSNILTVNGASESTLKLTVGDAPASAITASDLNISWYVGTAGTSKAYEVVKLTGNGVITNHNWYLGTSKFWQIYSTAAEIGRDGQDYSLWKEGTTGDFTIGIASTPNLQFQSVSGDMLFSSSSGSCMFFDFSKANWSVLDNALQAIGIGGSSAATNQFFHIAAEHTSGVAGSMTGTGGQIKLYEDTHPSNANNVEILFGTSGPVWTTGAGTPEGSVTAKIGSMYTRTDGGAGTTLYVKESGTGNTGWVAK